MFIKYYRALGLRRGVLHHVACWIVPHLQVASLALLEGFIYRLVRCERSGQTHRIIPLILITWYQSNRVEHSEVFG